MDGVFVTGTGTGVGKTALAAVIARTAAAAGRRVAVFKPALSGLEEYRPRHDPAGAQRPDLPAHGPEASGTPGGTEPFSRGDGDPDHELLRRAAGSTQTEDEITPYRYGPPLSPHLAAQLAGEEIDPARLLQGARTAAAGADTLICEGVGGFLVPLTPTYLVRDFARDLDLPIVVAASPSLGTINHTLLTLEAVRAAGLEPLAVVLTPWPEAAGALERSNRETIARLGRIDVRTLPPLDLAEPEGWPALELH